jgi:hypothetical protein
MGNIYASSGKISNLTLVDDNLYSSYKSYEEDGEKIEEYNYKISDDGIDFKWAHAN